MDDNSPRRGWSLLKILSAVLSVSLLLSACSGASDTEAPAVIPVTTENVIIQCSTDCSDLYQQITSVGGTVYRSYSNVSAIAATVPNDLLKRLQTTAGIKAINKDLLVVTPRPRHAISLNNATGNATLSTVNLNTSVIGNYLSALPKNYSFNNSLTGATTLHSQNITGRNVIVAVIDTGTANNTDIVPALEGSVIGGESFIPFPDEPSATSTLNDSHGTWVGTMIAAHLGIVIPNDTPIVESLLTHIPDSVLPYSDTESLIPMLGSAPEARLYAMKVFAANSGGTPASVLIAAMDRALTLKRNFNQGVPSVPVAGDGSEDNPYVYDSLNIQVVNLSLGGPAMFPGYELEDLLALQMLKEGITVVSAAGNEGFAAITGGSPGTSVASLTVGALNTPQHERILRDLQFGPGTGLAFRPNSEIQVAPFSSRGPTADGRTGLQVMANGFASFVQGADGEMALISGTSFASPTTAGAAALLWQAKPDANASQIRAALMETGNLGIFGAYQSAPIDRGNGAVNLPSALDLLQQQSFQPEQPQLPVLADEPGRVSRNIQPLGLDVIPLTEGNNFSAPVTLNPGEVAHFFLESNLRTDQITVRVSNYQTGLPIDQQNQIFGDAFFLSLIDAPTSFNDTLIDERVEGDMEFTISKPQSGLLRLALMGDWTNAGSVSATVQVETRERTLSNEFAEGKLVDEESDIYEVRVRGGVTALNFELTWEADWGQYPPHDIDLLLFDPMGEPFFDGATLDIPERVTIDNPRSGTWTIIVTGFMLHGFRDEYKLYVTDQNNNRLSRRSRRRD